jgi:hypothetical protein
MRPLRELVHDLDSQSGWDDPPRWVQVYPDQIIDNDNLERLIGFTAPDNCSAVALVAGGWGWSMDGPRAEAKKHRQRVRTTCAVSADGEVAGRVRWADGRQVDETPGSGRALDTLRRCFQLPTDPPEVSPGHYFAIQWLDSVCGAAARSHGKLTWPKAAALHPIVRAVEESGHHIPAEHLIALMRAGEKAWTWTEIRQQAIQKPHWLGRGLPPNAARWMDEGMLSRWLLGIFEPLDEMLVELDRLVPDGVARRIRRTLRTLDVLPAAPASA